LHASPSSSLVLRDSSIFSLYSSVLSPSLRPTSTFCSLPYPPTSVLLCFPTRRSSDLPRPLAASGRRRPSSSQRRLRLGPRRARMHFGPRGRSRLPGTEGGG